MAKLDFIPPDRLGVQPDDPETPVAWPDFDLLGQPYSRPPAATLQVAPGAFVVLPPGMTGPGAEAYLDSLRAGSRVAAFLETVTVDDDGDAAAEETHDAANDTGVVHAAL